MTLDLRVPFGQILTAMGVPATVTPDGGEAIETAVVWVPALADDMPVGLDIQRRERKRVLSIPRMNVTDIDGEFVVAGVPSVPRGSIVEAPEVLDGVPARWKVDGVERIEVDETRVLVVPVDES